MKVSLLLGGLWAACVALAAENPFAQAKLSFTSDRSGFYKVGEKMTFTVRLDGVSGSFTNGAYALQWFRRGDDRGDRNEAAVERGRIPLPLSEPFVYTTSIDRPGFVHLGVSVVDAAGNKVKDDANKPIDFEGGAGAEPERLEGSGEPSDFDAFWAARKARLQALPLTVDRREVPSDEPAVKIWAVVVNCAGARPMTGYLSMPAAASPTNRYPARCQYDGYSGDAVDCAPKRGPKDEILLHINAHGWELGREKEYYAEFYDSIRSGGHGYLFDDAMNKQTNLTYFVGMTYRVMRSLQYVKSLPEWNGKDLTVSGGSQGGLQVLWAAGLDSDVTRAEPFIPWCCDLDSRDRYGRIGGWRPNYQAALAYYDPVNVAKRIPRTCQVLLKCGLGDYVCPPSGMCVLYNNLTCPKKIVWNQGQRHGGAPNPTIQEFSFKSDDYID